MTVSRRQFLSLAAATGALTAAAWSDRPVVARSSAVATPGASAAPTVAFVGEITGGAEPFQQIVDVAIAPNGDLWVVDAYANEMVIFAPDGTFRETRGTPGIVEGKFHFGENGSVVFDKTGAFYVMEDEQYRIQKFDADRNFVTAWGGPGRGEEQLYEPSDLAIDGEGNIYVCDSELWRIQKFAPDGSLLKVITGPRPGESFAGDLPRLGSDADGNILVANVSRVYRLSPDDVLVQELETAEMGEAKIGYAIDTVTDAAGNLYVSDAETNRMLVFDAAGAFITAWGSSGSGPGQFMSPESLAMDDRFLYVLDHGNNRVQLFRPLSAPGA